MPPRPVPAIPPAAPRAARLGAHGGRAGAAGGGRLGGTGVAPRSLGGDFHYTQQLLCTNASLSAGPAVAPGAAGWAVVTRVPSDRTHFAAAAAHGWLVVLGGWMHGVSARAEAFDGRSRAWLRLPDMPTARFALAAAVPLASPNPAPAGAATLRAACMREQGRQRGGGGGRG